MPLCKILVVHVCVLQSGDFQWGCKLGSFETDESSWAPKALWKTWRKYVKVHHSLELHFLPKHHLTHHLSQRMTIQTRGPCKAPSTEQVWVLVGVALRMMCNHGICPCSILLACDFKLLSWGRRQEVRQGGNLKGIAESVHGSTFERRLLLRALLEN